jgi:geranylgeranyl pyrophosphate synthase
MANKRLAEKALAILQAKSEKALKNAKELILKEKFRCEKANEALRYYVATWNDTTRPGVLALAYEAVGGKAEEVVPLQTAMLFIDAAMDIHDDIIDKSTKKGSKETLYGKFGEETALLIGNALLVKGFNHLHKVTGKLPLNKKKLINDAVKKFLFEVIDAHIQESMLKSDKWNVEPAEYLKILEQKASDIEGHMQIGSIFGKGSVKEIKILTTYGKCLGTLLALRSDFVDIFEPAELTSRIKFECLPLPLLFALQNKNYRSKTLQVLRKEVIDESDASKLIEIIYETQEISDIKKYLEKLKHKASKSLSKLQDKAVQNLELLINASLEDIIS